MKLFNNEEIFNETSILAINVEEIYSDINDLNLMEINITTAINEVNKLEIAKEHIVELDNLGIEAKEVSNIKNLLVTNIYSSLGMRNVLVSQESIKETISKAVTAVKEFLIKLFNKVVEFIKKIKKFIVDNCRKAYNKINKSFGSKEEPVKKLISDEDKYNGYKTIIENAIKEKDWKNLEELLNSRVNRFPDLFKMIEDALENKPTNSNESLTENIKDKELIVNLINSYTIPIIKTNYKFTDIAKDDTYVGSLANYLKVINIMNYDIVKETTSIINNEYISGKSREWLIDNSTNSLKEIEKALNKIISLTSNDLKSYLNNISSNKHYNFIEDKARYGVITSYSGILVLIEALKINDITKYNIINFKIELSKPLIVDNNIKVIDDKSKNEILKEIQNIESNSNWIIDVTDKAQKQLNNMTDKMNDNTYNINSNLFKTWSTILLHINKSSFNNSVLVSKLSDLIE